MIGSVREIDDIQIFDLKGEIDLYNAPKIDKEIAELVSENKLKILMNFKDVSYIDSSGIGMLLSNLSNLRKKGSTMKLSNLNQDVYKVFRFAKLTTFFEIFDNETDAIESFRNSEK